MQSEVERGGVAPTDVLKGPLRQQVGHVAGLIHRDIPLVEIEFPGGFAVAEVVDAAAQNAIKLIEAMSERAVLGEEAEVPLADQRGFVAPPASGRDATWDAPVASRRFRHRT